MSFNLRNIRELPSDPLAKFTNELSKKLSRFLTKDQLDLLDDREDIYTDGQDFDSAIKYHADLLGNKTFNFTTEYYPPTEPDNDKLRLWLRGTNLGNTLRDYAHRDNVQSIPEIWGEPMLIDGTPFDDGIKTGGVKSIALRFNRNDPEDYIKVENDALLRASADLVTGISFFMRFRVSSIAEQGGRKPTLFEKTDNDPITDGVVVAIDDVGRLRINIMNSGIDNAYQTASLTIGINTVYDLWITYNKTGDVVKCYVNNVEKSLSATSAETFHSDATDLDYYLMRRGGGSENGFVTGDLYDFRIYREKVVSATEVSRMFTNKWTIANIPYGQVLIANYWAPYAETVLGKSFTSASFTSASFEV